MFIKHQTKQNGKKSGGTFTPVIGQFNWWPMWLLINDHPPVWPGAIITQSFEDPPHRKILARYAQICPSPRSRCAGPWTFLPTCSLNICDPLWLQTYKWPNFGTQTNTHKAIWATQILARYTQADQDICKDFRSFNPCFRSGASYVLLNLLNTLIGHLRVELVGNFWPKWLYLKP